jgi:CubicO group peptidase (beta-lactamase class C family)
MHHPLLLTLALALMTPAHAQMTPLMQNSLRFSMAPFGLVATSGRGPMELPAAAPSPELDAATQKIDTLFAQSPAAMAWLVWRNGQLVYERYGAQELRTRLVTSFSVSKTLTGLMVGQAICDQKIKSLDDLAVSYEPRLAGTPYEKNTLRSLLTMTTGVEHTPAQGGQDLNALWRQEKTTLETIREKRRLTFQESHFNKTFNYDNTATNVLGLVVRAATGQPVSDYFSRSFYQPADPAQAARWLRDKAGEEFAMGSFLAIPRDHLRLSVHLLKILRGEAGDACIQTYAQEMVKKAVSTPPRPPVHGTDTGYGFQVWTHLSDLQPDTIEMRGYGGQHVFVSPSQKTVIVILTASDQRADERSMQNAKSAVKVFLGR